LTGDKSLYAVWSISHEATKVDRVEPDCTHEGKEEYWSCACGKYFEDASANVEITDLSAWGILPVRHTFTEWVEEVSATCASEGVKAHKDCGICAKHFDAEGNEIADLTIAINPAVHRFGAWVEEIPATEDAEGVKGHKDCDFCHRHFDADGNEITDLTIAKLTAGGEEPEEPAKGGCGSVAFGGARAVAGICVFSVVWFVIRKRNSQTSSR
ncbi:MAG: hypothetical protein ACI4ST_02155, partial [Candidatus Gallimonas sp.]